MSFIPTKADKEDKLIEQLAYHHQTFFSFIQNNASKLSLLWKRYGDTKNPIDIYVKPSQQAVESMMEYASVMDHPALYANIVGIRNSLKKIETGIAHQQREQVADEVLAITKKFAVLIAESEYCSATTRDSKLQLMFERLTALRSFDINHEVSQGVTIFSKYSDELRGCHANFRGFDYVIHEPNNILELERLYEGKNPTVLIIDDEKLDEPGVKTLIIKIKSALTERLRLILISNSNSHESELAAVRIGANQHLVRPIDKFRLTDILKNTALIRSTSLTGLVVNQIAALNDYIEFIFSFVGIDIIKAINAKQVSPKIKQYRPEFVILSDADPSIEAHEIAKFIRYDQKNSAICIHQLSNSSTIKSRFGSVQQNINQTINGPISAESLIQTIFGKTLEFYSVAARQPTFEKELLSTLNQHAIVSVTDRAGIIDYANDQFCKVSKYDRKELIGRDHSLLNSDHHPTEFFRQMWRTISAGKTWKGIVKNKAKDGSTYWVDSTIHPVLNDLGVAYRYISIRTDITDSVLLKHQYEEQRNELQLIIDSAPSILLFVDQNGVLRKVNRSASKAFAKPVDQLEGFPLAQFFDSDDIETITSGCRRVIQSGKAEYGVVEQINVMGSARWISSSIIPFTDTMIQASGALIFADDISDLIESRKELEASEKRLQTSQSLGKIGSWDFDVTSSIIHISDAFFDILGIPSSHRGEGLSEEILAMVHREDQPKYSNILRAAIAGEHPNGFTFDYRVIRNDRSVIWLSLTANSTRDPDGSNIHLMGVTRDITAQTHLMQQRDEYEKRLIDAKNEAETANRAKSIFLSSMSHELRTPLNAIIGFSQLMLMEADSNTDPQLLSYPTEIFNAGQHLLDLINDILDLARIESGKQEVLIKSVELSTLLSETISLISPLLSEHFLTLNIYFDGTATLAGQVSAEILVRADRKQLKQCLLNLISNAIKYNRKGGQIDIHINTCDDGQVYIGVADSGIGLSEQQQENLFQPFSRLSENHDEIEGTGIGLVITKQMIQQMHGTIGVKSTLGEGSTFWIKLPGIHRANTFEAEAEAISLASSMSTTATQHILYVEDNPGNLNLIENILKSRPSIKLVTTEDPQMCIPLASKHQPKLILLNANLADQNGYNLLVELSRQKEAAAIPVISIGHPIAGIPSKKQSGAGFDHYISHPINIHELLKNLDRLID
ncbi:MAG: PAS domain S-box protein [Pseudomonadales bacterium]|nr:PAS domain S-box protein [Pseudomonadales bacterium]